MTRYEYSSELIQQYKTALNFKTDTELAASLPAMRQPNVNQIRNAEKPLTAEQGLVIAEKCGLDIGEVLVKLDMERTKNPAVQQALSSLLKRIATAVAVVSLSLSLMMSPQSHDAAASV